MSKRAITFVRPYLRGTIQRPRSELGQACPSIQRRFRQTIAAEDFIGSHDVEKQKRLEQLKKVKPLADYHPRLDRPVGTRSLSLREFNTEYNGIEAMQDDVLSVFGTICGSDDVIWADNVRKGAISAIIGLKVDVP